MSTRSWFTLLAGLTIACGEKDGTSDSGADGVDESVWYLDADSDGFGGELLDGERHVDLGVATTHRGGDCDDAVPSTHPGAGETCDGIDNDCNGLVDEGCEATDEPRVEIGVDAGLGFPGTFPIANGEVRGLFKTPFEDFDAQLELNLGLVGDDTCRVLNEPNCKVRTLKAPILGGVRAQREGIDLDVGVGVLPVYTRVDVRGQSSSNLRVLPAMSFGASMPLSGDLSVGADVLITRGPTAIVTVGVTKRLSRVGR